MRRLLPFALLSAAACANHSADVGAFTLRIEDGSLAIDHAVHGPQLKGMDWLVGTGDAEVRMSFGAFRFDDVVLDLKPGRLGTVRDHVSPVLIDVRDADGEPLATLTAQAASDDVLVLELSPRVTANRLGFEAPCDADDHFLGLGSHAWDVDHVGEAFGLWVSEPGIGKTETDVPPADWFVTGTRHASSFPVPFLLRPHRAQGLLVDSFARVEVDLCATDSDTFRAVAWDDNLRVVLVTGSDALDTVEHLTAWTGRPDLPPPWVFGPWNDAIRGTEQVRAMAATLRDAGAPSSVIWTEDWKGGVQTSLGYSLTGEWFVDDALYPQADALAAELEADGFKWLAYFAPFVEVNTVTWNEALAAGVLVKDVDGQPYTFAAPPRFADAGLVDVSTQAGRSWIQERLQAALDLGFDGWMADFAEWLPWDARQANGERGAVAHNLYPLGWQLAHAELLRDTDTTFFVRSGWTGTGGVVPVVWAGDQRTSFDRDDGLPTVLPLGLGLSSSGVPIYTHDVAGYQSVGNDPSDRELWLRWAALGAFSPILRTHHGAFDTDNWRLDRDAQTLAAWVGLAREHTRLHPYRYGLAARAAERGTPMILPVAMLHPGEPWDRIDAWMLGEALLVAPVLERGVTGRQVDLPADTTWYDWFTLQPAASGWFEVEAAGIPVFAAAGTTVPTLTEIPQTLMADVDGRIDLGDVDGGRTVYLFGGGGVFTEADGTTYTPRGTATGSAEATATLQSGEVDVGGLTVAIDGQVQRTYRLIAVAP